ncbi:MAG: (Fe-S)-binding protein [Myxococcota bacterium]
MSPIGMTLLLVSTLAFFAWTAQRRWRQLTVGQAEPRFSVAGGELVGRIKDTLKYALGQRKMPYYRWAGIAHIMIFGGFIVLALRTVWLWIRGFDADFDFWGVLGPEAPLGIAYGFAKDTVVLLVLFGVAIFVYYRVVKHGKDSVADKPRMTLGFEGLLILGIIATMMIADVLYDGAGLVLQSRELGHAAPEFHTAEFAGSIAARALWGIESQDTLTALWHAGFWVHSALVLIFLNILPYSKHFHIITVFPNVFTRDRRPEKLPKVEDLEGKVEREESLGINKVTDLTWNQILDLYTCTECGRCSDNCPAFVTDKKLSPKHLTLALRDHLYDAEEDLFGKEGVVDPEAGGEGTPGTIEAAQADARTADGKEEIHTYPRPPADGYFTSSEVVELVPNIVHPDVIWACTTCRACEEQCPVMISYVDKIVGMRREELMMKNEFPPELQGAFQGMETNGNPWNVSAMDRGDWAEGLDIPLISDNPDAGVLYWVGCASSFDDRAKKIARAVAKLLKQAGVDFAILGSEETCTGDPARRAGNEYLFQMLAEQNVETLNGYGVDKKTVITACPHCFNTLGNEYADFGGKFDVVHHTEFLNGLLARKKLVPTKPVEGRIAFHDSCYLGRYNDVYDSPRDILKSIPGVELVEVPYWNRNKGLCCGAGGAQMWMEEQNKNRVNNKRTLQLLDTGAKTVTSACPFCMTMITDGIKAQEKEEEISQLDVAEVLVRSIDFGDESEVAEAAQ